MNGKVKDKTTLIRRKYIRSMFSFITPKWWMLEPLHGLRKTEWEKRLHQLSIALQ